ncbi:hypothetical protein ACLESO_43335 [Pyxidicoccus sp. 3LG]
MGLPDSRSCSSTCAFFAASTSTSSALAAASSSAAHGGVAAAVDAADLPHALAGRVQYLARAHAPARGGHQARRCGIQVRGLGRWRIPGQQRGGRLRAPEAEEVRGPGVAVGGAARRHGVLQRLRQLAHLAGAQEEEVQRGARQPVQAAQQEQIPQRVRVRQPVRAAHAGQVRGQQVQVARQGGDGLTQLLAGPGGLQVRGKALEDLEGARAHGEVTLTLRIQASSWGVSVIVGLVPLSRTPAVTYSPV